MNQIRYILKDYHRLQKTNESVSGLVDVKIVEYDEKLTLSLDNRLLKLIKEVDDKYATKEAMNRSEKTLKKQADANTEAIEVLEDSKIEITGFVKGARWIVLLLISAIAWLGYDVTFNKGN